MAIETIVRVKKQGRITIPKQVQLGESIHEGDFLRIAIEKIEGVIKESEICVKSHNQKAMA